MQQDLDKEIEELERQMFSSQGEPESTEQPIQTESVNVEETQAPTQDQWEKRFKNYKASTDLTIRDLRSDLANSKTKYANLQKEYADLVKKLQDVPTKNEDIFTEEEIEILGEPAVNALNKGVKEIIDKKVKPLEEEVQRSRRDLADREAKEAQQLALTNYNKFLKKLGEKVPDYEAINTSDGFLKYMSDVDEDSGYPRSHLFRKAEEALDVKRIAEFFSDYKRLLPKSKGEVLDSAITPQGTRGVEAPTGKEKEPQVISRGFIDKFYEDFNRGKFRGKEGRAEAERIEQIIERAVMEGRVR
jgi:hypothetical protein